MADVPMIPTVINGRWNLLLPEHRAARPHWTRPEGWERERLDSMHDRLQAGDVVFDVGTEEGDISGLIASWVGPTGGMVLIEPNPRVWPNARAIWDANDLRPPLATFVGFAADHMITYPPDMDEAMGGPRYGWPPSAYGDVIGDHGFSNLCERPDVPRIRLDELAAVMNRVPNAITIDVEGSEMRVLLGAERLLAAHGPLVWVSVHDAFMRDMYGDTPAALDAYMAGHGYGRTLLAVDHEAHVLYEKRERR